MKILTLLSLLFSLQLSANDGQLSELMGLMNDELRGLTETLDDSSQNFKNLKHAVFMRHHTQQASQILPDGLSRLPDDQRQRMVQMYNDLMDRLLVQMDELSLALASEDNSAASEHVDQIKVIRREGHQVFRRQ